MLKPNTSTTLNTPPAPSDFAFPFLPAFNNHNAMMNTISLPPLNPCPIPLTDKTISYSNINNNSTISNTQANNNCHSTTCSGGKPMKQCANPKCLTTKTPLWRKGWCIEEPSSKNNFKPKTVFLCNKCGLHYRKGHYCKECLEIFKESDMRNEKQFWIICGNCNQWIHKKCLKENNDNNETYICRDCQHNPNRAPINKRKKNNTSSEATTSTKQKKKSKQTAVEPQCVVYNEKKEVASPQMLIEEPKIINIAPSPLNIINNNVLFDQVPLKKRGKYGSNQISPVKHNPKVSDKLEIDGYSSSSSDASPVSENEDIDYSSGMTPTNSNNLEQFRFQNDNSPTLSKSPSLTAIDLLASICEHIQQ
ncbi:hypothetical protein ABK040_005710 [Willaertia magna]